MVSALVKVADKGVGAVRLGRCEYLREVAMERVLPDRLTIAEGVIHVDNDRPVRRRSSMNIYREVVEFRARPGIVGSVPRLVDFVFEDEIGTRHIEKSVRGSERAARLARMGRRLEDCLAHCDRIDVPVLGRVPDETGDDRAVTRGHRASADHGEQVIRALVILLTALAPGKVIIERLLHARIGEWRGRRDRWRAVGIL